ncbi:hypothetical protein JS756_32285 [Streptomyces actuosus]|uniref:Uncharacterized protein n=1 Tax=Streptomyces actuosus TaxID=1885 RepID=A0ABS2W086_STRAS|nr:hypothetical protein [Streptomyces actuosus]MBN0048689.1 hypothetical protein [Streptomyces actuosus]
MLVLGVQRVEGDGAAGQVEVGRQRLEGGDLAALVRDSALVQGQSAVVGDHGHEVERALFGGVRAAGLAVQGHGLAGVGKVGEPGADGRVEGVAVQAGQQGAEGAGAGCGSQPEAFVQVGCEFGGMRAIAARVHSASIGPRR